MWNVADPGGAVSISNAPLGRTRNTMWAARYGDLLLRDIASSGIMPQPDDGPDGIST